MTLAMEGTGTTAVSAVLEPDVARAVEAMGDAPYADLDALPVKEAIARVRFPASTPLPANSEDRWIDWDSGRKLRIRLYRPEGSRSNLPVLMYLHGGGFVSGTVEMDDARCIRLARDAECIVASVDYPLAPEDPFPVPTQAAFAAWNWILSTADDFGGDSRRVAISGSSAGGHLAIGVCLLARDTGATLPLLQLLTYPVVTPEFTSGSYEQFADGPFLTRARMAWYWRLYGGSIAPQGSPWSPLEGSLAGLPPAHVILAECDVLRDDGEAYAAALRAAGVNANAQRYPGMIHGFVSVLAGHPAASAALDECAAALRQAFARPINQ